MKLENCCVLQAKPCATVLNLFSLWRGGGKAGASWAAIPENREFKKWKFSFFHQRHTLLTSFDIFVVTYRVTNFLPKLIDMLLFSTEETEFPFLVFPYFPVMPSWAFDTWGKLCASLHFHAKWFEFHCFEEFAQKQRCLGLNSQVKFVATNVMGPLFGRRKKTIFYLDVCSSFRQARRWCWDCSVLRVHTWDRSTVRWRKQPSKVALSSLTQSFQLTIRRFFTRAQATRLQASNGKDPRYVPPWFVNWTDVHTGNNIATCIQLNFDSIRNRHLRPIQEPHPTSARRGHD